MAPCEYEKYDDGDVFLGDDKKARIVRRGKFKLNLQGGRIKTLPGVLSYLCIGQKYDFCKQDGRCTCKNIVREKYLQDGSRSIGINAGSSD